MKITLTDTQQALFEATKGLSDTYESQAAALHRSAARVWGKFTQVVGDEHGVELDERAEIVENEDGSISLKWPDPAPTQPAPL